MIQMRITKENSIDISVSQDDNDKKIITIKATDSICNIVKIKVAIGENIDSDYFKTNGQELQITPGKKVEVKCSVSENCILNIYVEDEEGYKVITTRNIIDIPVDDNKKDDNKQDDNKQDDNKQDDNKQYANKKDDNKQDDNKQNNNNQNNNTQNDNKQQNNNSNNNKQNNTNNNSNQKETTTNNQSNVNNNSANSSTTSQSNLPKTGWNNIMLVITTVIVAICAVVSFVKYKKIK